MCWSVVEFVHSKINETGMYVNLRHFRSDSVPFR